MLCPSAAVATLWIGHVGLRNTHTRTARVQRMQATHIVHVVFICSLVRRKLMMTNDLLTTQDDDDDDVTLEQESM